jgi:hypothetical protein
MGELMGNMQPTHQSEYGLLAILKRELSLDLTRTISEEELKKNQEFNKFRAYKEIYRIIRTGETLETARES